jgi:hypothetical protein
MVFSHSLDPSQTLDVLANITEVHPCMKGSDPDVRNSLTAVASVSIAQDLEAPSAPIKRFDQQLIGICA